MGNPMWVAGEKSPNPAGRPKHSVRTVKGMCERFLKKNFTPNKLQKMFDALKEKERLEMLLELLPYAIPKQAPEGLSESEIDRLYKLLQEAIAANNTNNAKAS